ncbi:MAG: ylxH [Geminicoccaceae bacterium]|nr:ylxH [Geminicoccaceae bacterium]
MSRILAIASGKGGVGKTWLAISLSHALARQGRRVLLFDGDLGLANVDVQLGLGPGADLATVLSGRCAMAAAVRTVETCGFDVLPGRSGSGGLGAVDPALLDGALAELLALARAYDVTLLDLPAGIDHAVRRLLLAARLRLVVTIDEPTALTDAYALIKVHQRDGGLAAGLALAVNLAESHEAGRETHAGLQRVCAHFLQLRPPLGGVVRRDPRVADAVRHQAPLLLRHPTSPAARDVEALAGHLLAA